MNDNTTIEFTFDDESGQLEGATAENKVLKELADLNYDKVTQDAVIGVVPTANGYSIKLMDNVNSSEYLKELPGYNKISQLIEQTKKITDILPEGVSVDDYNESSICCVKYLFETLLEKKKRLYICYDAAEDRVLLSKQQHDHYVELSISKDIYFDIDYNNLKDSVNLVFKIFNDCGTERTVPINPFYYNLCVHYDKGMPKTKVCFTNPHVGFDASAFALVSIKAIDGTVDPLLTQKVVESVERGKLTLYSIQYMIQEILYSIAIENTPDIPQLYLTNDKDGNLIWQDLSAVTLHSDGVTIKKKNVFFEERNDYGNIDYDIYLGFDPDRDPLNVEFLGIRNYDENAMLVIADNQLQTNYTCSYYNDTLRITFAPESFSTGIADDGQLSITVILLTSSDVEKSEFAKDYITRKEALKLLNGERLNIDGFVTDEKLDKILREYGYNIAVDEFGDRVAIDVRTRYNYDADSRLIKDIVVDNSKWPDLPEKYRAGHDSVRQILTDILNPYLTAEQITDKFIIPRDIKYTLYKKDIDGNFYEVNGNSLYFADEDDIYISFKPVNKVGSICEFTVANVNIDLHDVEYRVDPLQLELINYNLYKVLKRSELLVVEMMYSLPDALCDSYGEFIPTEETIFDIFGSIIKTIKLPIDYPNIITANVGFNSQLELDSIILASSVNDLPNAIRTNEDHLHISVDGAKYLFIAVEDGYSLDKIVHIESNSLITNFFERSEVKAFRNKDNYNVYEYIFGRDDIYANYEIYIKKEA